MSLANYCWKRRDRKPRFGIVSFREARALARAPRLEVLSVLVAAWPRQKKGRALIGFFSAREANSFFEGDSWMLTHILLLNRTNTDLKNMRKIANSLQWENPKRNIRKTKMLCSFQNTAWWEGREQRKATSGAACAFERKDLCQVRTTV